MKGKRLVVLLVVTLSLALLGQRIPASSSNPPSVDTFADVHLTVDPEGVIAVSAAVNDTAMSSGESLLNSTVLGAVTLTGDTVHLNLTLLVPEANASSFPFNTTTVTASAVYVGGDLDVNLNLTATAPSKSTYCPFLSDDFGAEACELLESLLNSTDFVLDAAFLEGDATFTLEYEMTANMSDLLSSMVNLPVGFQAPFTVNLNLSSGSYEGMVNFILVPGLPVEDVAVDVEGNLTSLCVNGSIHVLYGIYPEFDLEINQTFVDDMERMFEQGLNASIDEEGSILNLTRGMVACPYVNVDRVDLNGGEDVTFMLCLSEAVPGGMLRAITNASLVAYLGEFDDLPVYSDSNTSYTLLIPFILNDTLRSIQDGQLHLVYTPANTRLYLTMEGTLHVLDLLNQLLVPKDVPEEWAETTPQLNATTLPYEWFFLRALNATVHAVDTASYHAAYSHATRTVEVNFTASADFAFYTELVTLLAEQTGLEIPADLIPLLEGLMVDVTILNANMTYTDGTARLLLFGGVDGGVNAKADRLISDLLVLVNATGDDLAPWQVSFLNDTLFDLSTLTLDVAVDPVATTFTVDGLTVHPAIDVVNATAFTLDRFFNLSAESMFPDTGQQLQVAITGASNATHRVVLATTTGVPAPDVVTRNADQEIVQMTWHNVSFTDLRALHFLVVAGADQTLHHVIPYNSVDYAVATLSNSAVTDVTFDQPSKRLSFDVTGASGTSGYCNVTIPNQLLGGTFVVLVNDVPVTPTITQNSTHNFLYFEYTHSTQLVEIIGTTVIPEFPTTLLLGLLLSLIAVYALLTRTRHA